MAWFPGAGAMPFAFFEARKRPKYQALGYAQDASGRSKITLGLSNRNDYFPSKTSSLMRSQVSPGSVFGDLP
jgi:hypothetical protein